MSGCNAILCIEARARRAPGGGDCRRRAGVRLLHSHDPCPPPRCRGHKLHYFAECKGTLSRNDIYSACGSFDRSGCRERRYRLCPRRSSPLRRSKTVRFPPRRSPFLRRSTPRRRSTPSHRFDSSITLSLRMHLLCSTRVPGMRDACDRASGKRQRIDCMRRCPVLRHLLACGNSLVDSVARRRRGRFRSYRPRPLWPSRAAVSGLWWCRGPFRYQRRRRRRSVASAHGRLTVPSRCLLCFATGRSRP